jgi:4-hydroxyphenylpyruvate dioxygenase
LRDFENFAGAASSSSSYSTLPGRLLVALERAEEQIRLMPTMGTDLLLVCSNFLPYDPIATGSTTWEQYRDDQIVALTELGKVAARYNVRVGYEPLAWGTVVNRWEQVWEVVREVNMDNVGVILDSFNSL